MVVPALFLIVDYASHTLAKNDAGTATEQGGLYAMKQGVVEGSLRDTNVTEEKDGSYTDKYRTQIAVDPDPTLVEKGFNGSMNRHTQGSLINVADQDTNVGISHSPPMIALRTNTVNTAIGFRSVAKLLTDRNADYVIQNEKVIILEMKETD